MPNSVIKDLKSLQNTQFLPSDKLRQKIKKNIQLIVARCDQYYNDQAFYGNAALNRKILLDPIVSENLTVDVIQFLMSAPDDTQPKITRKNRNEDVQLTLKDIILFGFADGLDAIRLLPNNERDYGPQEYEQQKKAYDTNTTKILNAIKTAVNRTEDYEILSPSVTHKQFRWICDVIGLMKRERNRADELLYVPGYTAQEIRRQMEDGFRTLCQQLGLYVKEEQDYSVNTTLEIFCETFLSNNEALLNGIVSHLFYDRLHLTAALENQRQIIFADGNQYSYRQIFATLVEKIQNNPKKYPIAEEQFSLRFQLIEKTISEKFPEEAKYATENPGLYNEAGKYVLTEGPLPKSIYTVQLEKIAVQLLQSSDNVAVRKINGDYFIFFQNTQEIYNISEIMRYANFQHLQIEDDAVYLKYTESFGIISDITEARFNEIKNDLEKEIQNSAKDSVDQARDKQIQSAYAKLHLAEAQAINYYTTGIKTRREGYVLINNLLRNASDQTEDEIKAAIVHAVILGSGLRKLGVLQHETTPGKRVAERYFKNYGVSFEESATSKNVRQLSGFISATSNVADQIPAMKKFSYAQTADSRMDFISTIGFPIALLSENPEEKEILMPPGQVQVVEHLSKNISSTRALFAVRAVSDLRSYSELSLQPYQHPDDLMCLNYHLIASAFDAVNSLDPIVKAAATQLILIYQISMSQFLRSRELIEKGDASSETIEVLIAKKRAQNKLALEKIHEKFLDIINEIKRYQKGECAAAFLSKKMALLLNNAISNNDISSDQVASFFNTAAITGDGASVQMYCQLTGNNKPNKAAVMSALNVTIQNKKWDVLSYFFEMTGDNKPTQAAIIEAFVAVAVAEAKVDIVTPLTLNFMTQIDFSNPIQDFCRIWRSLKFNPELQNTYLETIKNKQPFFIKTAKDFFTLLSLLNSSTHPILFRAFKEQVVSLIKFEEDFKYVVQLLDVAELRTILEHFTEKQILDFCNGPCSYGFRCFLKKREVITLLISYEKTKSLFERSFANGGDFIDTMNTNIKCLEAGLKSDFYATEDGVRALQAALKRLLNRKERQQACMGLIIDVAISCVAAKLAELVKSQCCYVSEKKLSDTFSPGEIYNAIVNVTADFTSIKHDCTSFTKTAQSDSERTQWIYSVLNDQHEEMGRLIYPCREKNDSVPPHIIYFPGTVDPNVKGISLAEIKRFVDENIARTHSDLDLSAAIHRYVLITGENQYVAGVSQKNHLVVQGSSPRDEERSYDTFQQAVGCTSNVYVPRNFCSTNRNTVITSHASLLTQQWGPFVSKSTFLQDPDPKNKTLSVFVENELPRYPAAPVTFNVSHSSFLRPPTTHASKKELPSSSNFPG